MAARKGLGRGLDSMIPDKVGKAEAKPAAENKDALKGAIHVNINKVEPNRSQPRKDFDEESLQELAESIKQYGVIQPLVVQNRGDYYEIIAGERRWRAAKLAGLKQVPVLVKELTEQEMMEISLIENIQRENLNPIEEASAYKSLLQEFHLTQEDVAERVSKSRSAVTNSLRLLKLDERVQEMLVDRSINMGHARALLAVEDPEQQYELAQRVVEKHLSVREVEKLVKSLTESTETKTRKHGPKDIGTELTAIYQDLEEQMKVALGTKVSIRYKDEQTGRLEIEYYSQDELDRIIDLLRSVQA